MRKIILLTTLVFSLSVYCKAQENNSTLENMPDYRKTLIAGFKIGGNISNVYDTKGEAFNTDPKLGLAAGGFLCIPIGTFFGIQSELLFSQKGFRGTGSFLGNDYNLRRTSNYLDIPLMVTLKPTSMVTLMMGPQYSYLLSQKDVFTSGVTSIVEEQEFENANIRRNTFCFLSGIDINISHIVVSPRIGWDILNNNGDGTSTTPRYKNVWYQITLGYRFY